MSADVVNITEYLKLNAGLYPDKPAILHPVKLSFHDLDKEVDGYVAGLRTIGIKSGTRVILMVSDAVEFFVLCFALLRIGAVPVMIDPGMGTGAMARALKSCGAEAFIGVPRSHLLRIFYPDVFINIKTWINTGSRWVPFSKRSSLLKNNSFEPVPMAEPSDDDIAGIFYTSGSTGPPKAVLYHVRTMKAQVRLMKEHFAYRPEDIDLCTFPLLGLFVTCLGSSLVIADMNPLKPALLDPAKIVKNINDFGCTQMFGSPMILKKLLRYSKDNPVKLPSLKRAISAGAPVPVDTIRAFLELMPEQAVIHTPYGATEALPISDLIYRKPLEASTSGSDYSGGICIGKALPGVSIKIIRISDREIDSLNEDIICGENEIGEILVSGSLVTREYLNNSEANSLSKIIGPGNDVVWHRMGDLGRIDKNGLLWFYGRKNHRVELQGKCLYTIPVEGIFNQHRDVFRSALVGVKLEGLDKQIPLICVQPESTLGGKDYNKLTEELKAISIKKGLGDYIKIFLIHKNFPVDPRHNAKIFREKLAEWAQKKIK